MSAKRVPLHAFLDAGVPDSVGRALLASGHQVTFHRDVLPEKTPDQVVAATALNSSAVLVAIDKDMKQIAQRYGMTPQNDRFERLSVISFCCTEVAAAKRLEHAMPFVEFEWAFALAKAGRRMWIDIGLHYLKTNR
ncbi:MAG: hypothetical protein ACP5M1_08810 [Acidiphilium sp.]